MRFLICIFCLQFYDCYTPATNLRWGSILDSPCSSVRLPVRPSVRRRCPDDKSNSFHRILIFSVYVSLGSRSWTGSNILVHIWLWFITWTIPISKNSESKWPKWLWGPRSMTPIFNTSKEYPRMHVWCKLGDSSPRLWRGITWTSQIS